MKTSKAPGGSFEARGGLVSEAQPDNLHHLQTATKPHAFFLFFPPLATSSEIAHAPNVYTNVHALGACVPGLCWHKSPPGEKTGSRRPRTRGSPCSLTSAAAACSHPRRCRGLEAPGSRKATVHSPPLGLLPLSRSRGSPTAHVHNIFEVGVPLLKWGAPPRGHMEAFVELPFRSNVLIERGSIVLNLLI